MKEGGFTLLEVLLVLALLGILAGSVYPSYREYLVRARRSYALAALVDFAGRMEEGYALYNSYIPVAPKVSAQMNSRDRSYYWFGIKAEQDSYLLTAVPRGGQAQSDLLCGTLSLDHLGRRAISGTGRVESCWY